MPEDRGRARSPFRPHALRRRRATPRGWFFLLRPFASEVRWCASNPRSPHACNDIIRSGVERPPTIGRDYTGRLVAIRNFDVDCECRHGFAAIHLDLYLIGL